MLSLSYNRIQGISLKIPISNFSFVNKKIFQCDINIQGEAYTHTHIYIYTHTHTYIHIYITNTTNIIINHNIASVDAKDDKRGALTYTGDKQIKLKI